MFQLDLKSGVPICDQIVNGFIRLKALGVLNADEQLPSVRMLASQFSVNPNTIQKAYAILESNGIIYSVKGKGSFVSGDKRAANAVLDNAKKEFSKAVRSAFELGLTEKELKEIIEKHSNAEGEEKL